MRDMDRSFAGVFYDADCGFCVTAARRFERVLARRRLELVPLQTPDAGARLGVRDDRLLDEMRLRLQNGTVFGGADAVAEIARRIWWAWPLWALSRVPGAMRPMRATYGWVARHRSCANGACGVGAPRRLRTLDVLPLLVLPTAALLGASSMPRWTFMWVMACTFIAMTTKSEQPWPSDSSQKAPVRSASRAVNARGADACACVSLFAAAGTPSTVSP